MARMMAKEYQPLPDGVVFKMHPECPGYFIGDDGSVWSSLVRQSRGKGGGSGCSASVPHPLGFARRMSPSKVRGYLFTSVKRRDGVYRHGVPVHHLVLETFVGPKPDGMECCHGDGNPLNNSLSNLRWDTSLGNKDDIRRHGTMARGSRCGSAKLNEQQAKSIIARLAAGEHVAKLAREYGVSVGAVSHIKSGSTWAWVSEEKRV